MLAGASPARFSERDMLRLLSCFGVYGTAVMMGSLGECERRLAVDPFQIFRVAGRDRQCEELGHLVWMQLGERQLQGLESCRARLQEDHHLLLVGDLPLPPI